jgi:hypothetical protein
MAKGTERLLHKKVRYRNIGPIQLATGLARLVVSLLVTTFLFG